jgi:hypothetical protein
MKGLRILNNIGKIDERINRTDHKRSLSVMGLV